MADLAQAIKAALGVDVVSTHPLGGGCVGDVRRAALSDGRTIVVKQADANLDIEGRMLKDLSAAAVPAPDVLYAAATFLIMSYVEAGDPLSGNAEEHAADLIAGLHDRTAPAFGYDYDTLIGGLHQPNPKMESWRTFFRDRRLRFMADQAHDAGKLPTPVRVRVDTFAANLDRWIDDGRPPSMLHGDLWGGNVLCRNHRIAAFIDPAIYFGDAEIELAFSTLFHTFGNRFFDRYREHRTIDPGFFEVRKDIYNLYPLLVHVRLFGGHYVSAVERTLEKFGC